MSYEIRPDMDNYNELLPFAVVYDCLHDPNGTGSDGLRTFSHGKYVLIINEGGIQNADISSETKGYLKSYNWHNVYNLLQTMPRTASGKFTGKVVFHTNEAHLQKIEFIPKNKP